MKDIIVNKIYNLSTQNNLYKRLFGIDTYEFHTKYLFNFSIQKTTEIENTDISFFLDNIISKILHSNFDTANLEKKDTDEMYGKVIIDGNEYKNPFLNHIFEIDDIHLCDFENYLDDIIVKETDNEIAITWELPIYKL